MISKIAKDFSLIEIETDEVNCSVKECKEPVVFSTIQRKKIKKLPVEEIRFWCYKHSKEILKEESSHKSN